MADWLMLIANLPGRNQTLRMRIWRALKSAGAGLLRDGVYVLPHSDAALQVFREQAREVEGGAGSAQLVAFDSDDTQQRATLIALFDRTSEYSSLMSRLGRFVRARNRLNEPAARRELAVLKRESAALVAIDFFPTEACRHLEQALSDAQVQLAMRASPGEPHAIHRAVPKRSIDDFQGRVWSTRKDLWIDRVCSAWLISRFIDRNAQFRWFAEVKRRPARSIGFDFDDAEFTHADGKVTFEVLVTSFGLDQNAALSRLGHLVHYLDVGGVPVPEAAGLAAIVTGARSRCDDDDALVDAIFPVLDLLCAAYTEGGKDDETGDGDEEAKPPGRAAVAGRSARKHLNQPDTPSQDSRRARRSRNRR